MPFIMIGGRIHTENRLMDIDAQGNPPSSYMDILTGSTYYPRTVGYAINDAASGLPQSAYEALFYVLESMPPEQAVPAVSDALMRQYMLKHGRVVPLEVTVKTLPQNSKPAPSGLILPN